MPETAAPAVDFIADTDLISFLKAIPDGRYRCGVRYPQWSRINFQAATAGALDLAGWHCPYAVGVEQKHCHHPRIKTLFTAVILDHRRKQDL